VLSAQITLMLDLARERAGARAASGTRSGFARPVRGRISQRYGCQARRKGRGHRCASFHDGVDIAARRGRVVRASASGFVAYAGFSPWDRGRRAWIVVIGHAGGYDTVYAHLLPQRRVRAGQRVRRGQVIGRVGLTGRTSGAHVHWEVRRSFRTQNPLRAGR
jgi:murein DD-endopeptidase MepM/ murein hydrolase activator NlpD